MVTLDPLLQRLAFMNYSKSSFAQELFQIMKLDSTQDSTCFSLNYDVL